MQKITVTTTREKWKPSRDQLEALTGFRTYSGAAKELGLSHTAVRKWCTVGMSEKNYNKHFGSEDEEN